LGRSCHNRDSGSHGMATYGQLRPPGWHVNVWSAHTTKIASRPTAAPHTCKVWETSFKTHTNPIRSTGVIRPAATPFTGSQWHCSTGHVGLQALHSRRPNPLLANPIGRNRSTHRATNRVISQPQNRTVGRRLVAHQFTPQRGNTYLWGFTSETHMSNLR